MRQSEKKTVNQSETKKRGRGRPRMENPLTPAERAKRYRARKKAQKNSAPLAEKNDKNANDALFWREMYEAEARRAADLHSLADMFINARLKKKTIPADVFRNICQSFFKT